MIFKKLISLFMTRPETKKKTAKKENTGNRKSIRKGELGEYTSELWAH
jgi:hypothetical protein